MIRLLISPRAATDLEEIADYVALDSPKAAAGLIARFEKIAQLLSEQPGIGTKRSDLAKDLRGFALGNYLILYRDIGEGIEIIRFVHGARQLRDLI
jgi:toxin ParE1/3/4